jgi:hypothetical protein
MKLYVLVMLLAASMLAVAQHETHETAATQQQQAENSGGMDAAMPAMQHRHNDMGPHMKLTSLRPVRPGDQERADAVVAAARKVVEHYADYRDALADGFRIFLPNLPQKMYHFTNYQYAWEAAFGFNPEHPTSLLYEKTGAHSWKLVGVMYTAPARTTMEELDARIPLSIAQWHEHTNFCAAPPGHREEYFGKNAKFGLLGSITTREECEQAGGTFRPQVFGWMVHVYPNEKTQQAIWSVERQMEHGD